MDVLVNAAMSADGKLSTRERRQVAISGPEDFARVDRLRADVDAVMVGVGTVIADDPSLTIDAEDLRERRVAAGKPAQPTRIVADSTARTPREARILDDAAPSVVLVAEDAPSDRVEALSDPSTTVVAAGDERVDLERGLAALAAEGIGRLLVEGGGELIFSLFAAGLVDELSVYVGNRLIGGRDAPTLADGDGFTNEEAFPTLALRGVERIDDGVLVRWSVDDRP